MNDWKPACEVNDKEVTHLCYGTYALPTAGIPSSLHPILEPLPVAHLRYETHNMMGTF